MLGRCFEEVTCMTSQSLQGKLVHMLASKGFKHEIKPHKGVTPPLMAVHKAREGD